MQAKQIERSNHQLKQIIPLFIIIILILLSIPMSQRVQAQEGAGIGPESGNLIRNGNFEKGFYQVYALGFEAHDIGNVPNQWDWYKSQTYGKVSIDGNEGFGLVCAEDDDQGVVGKVSLSFYMQSTDQQDARLGVYQTIDVVPGQEYLFHMIGSIQAQIGADSPDQNNNIELYFDPTGGDDWEAIPHEEWTTVPWKEQELEFKISGPEDPDLAQIESYSTVVEAESDKMTIFITAWRRWANWRTSVFTIDCVSLVPLDRVNVPAVVPTLSDFSTTSVDKAVDSPAGRSQPQPSAAVDIQPDTAPAPVTSNDTNTTTAENGSQPSILPNSGRILDVQKNWAWLGMTSVILIGSLVGAGAWNIRRQRKIE